MTTLVITVIGTAIAWFLFFALFVYALRARWLARHRAGFFISMLIALVGVALMSASVVGVWGYQAAKQIIDRELAVELEEVGGLVDNQMTVVLDDLVAGLREFGASLVPLVGSHVPANQLQDRLRAVQSFNRRFVQFTLFDQEGRSLATSGVEAGAVEAMGRVALAYGLDGKGFASDPYLSPIYKRQLMVLSLPLREGNGPVAAVIGVWYDVQSEFIELIKGTRFNQSGYAVLVDGNGRIIAHPDPTRINDDVSGYPAVRLARETGRIGTVTALNSLGQSRLFGYRPLKNPATLGTTPWVLLTEIDESEQLALLRTLRRELAIGVSLVLLCGLVVARQVSRSIQQPLQTLGDFAHRIGSGDLTGRTSVSGQDVAGRLAAALNEMAAGLRERDHVREVFGRYVATQVSAQILNGQVNLGGESRHVTVLFSDIRSFTTIAEQMTPAQVVTFLNDYFSEMVDAVFEQNGMLDKFLGDGLMAVFGAFGDTPDHARRAVLAALRMKALLAKINGERAMAGRPPIAIGVGIHSDEVIVGNIGSRKRLEFTVVGDGVNVSSRLQTLNKEFGSTILVSETTFLALNDEFECRLMPDTPLRGRGKELKFYEVLSVKASAHA